MKQLKKYYIGLAVLGGLTLVLLLVVVSKGSDHKHDKNVNESAIEIASDLNNYIRDESLIPEKLSSATSQSIPPEINYTKKSSSEYEFCVTYRGDSGSSFSPSSVLYQGISGSYSRSYDYEPRTRSTLYISSYSWDKGDNCYKVKPAIYNSSRYRDLDWLNDLE